MKAHVSSNFIEDIQILRALAVIFTILQHLWILAPNYGLYRRLVSTVNFWGGVDLFFVVSGFVIGRELLILAAASQPISDFWLHMRSFWVRRAFRILPTAWLWIAIALVLSLTFNATGAWGAFTDNLGEGISAILQCANFRHHQILISAAHFGSLSHYWSLSLEEQFYLLMPFLIFLAAGRLTFILITLTLVQFLIPRGVGDWLWDFRSDALMIGVLIALGRHKSSSLLFVLIFWKTVGYRSHSSRPQCSASPRSPGQ